MTMIDLCKKILFTNNWIRSRVTIVINNLQAMSGTGWGRAIGKRYSCDWKHSLDSAGMNHNNWSVLSLSITTEDKLSKGTRSWYSRELHMRTFLNFKSVKETPNCCPLISPCLGRARTGFEIKKNLLESTVRNCVEGNNDVRGVAVLSKWRLRQKPCIP